MCLNSKVDPTGQPTREGQVRCLNLENKFTHDIVRAYACLLFLARAGWLGSIYDTSARLTRVRTIFPPASLRNNFLMSRPLFALVRSSIPRAVALPYRVLCFLCLLSTGEVPKVPRAAGYVPDQALLHVQHARHPADRARVELVLPQPAAAQPLRG